MLTIGDFSRLSRVTPRMLRHYDALGLLRPETVGENGPLLVLDNGNLAQQLRQRRLELCQELNRKQE